MFIITLEIMRNDRLSAGPVIGHVAIDPFSRAKSKKGFQHIIRISKKSIRQYQAVNSKDVKLFVIYQCL